MSAKTSNFKLGLFTLFGLGILLTGLLAFGTWSTLEKKTLFETYVAGDVSGLSVGSAVEFRGVRAGKVTGIGFSWDHYEKSQPGWVVVVFEMKDGLFGAAGSEWHEQLQSAIDDGLRARLKSQGVTGTCIVSLEYLDPVEYPATKVPWTPTNTYIPSAPGLLGDLLVSLQTALHKVNRLDVTGLNEMAQTDLKSVGRVLDKVERLDLEGLSTNANALLTEIRGSTAKLDTFIDDTDDTVKKLQLEKLTRDADALVGQLQDTVGKLEPGLTSVDFDSLNQTLAKAQQTVQNMNDLLDQLKKYPSGFIFGKPPPRLKELQSTDK
ncbi:MAG TPA: MlaD family protein [Candidatus Baltobacteraceae bacterium]|jgi:ABC-type transporter Mla subunit MlaD|nr:MlaD family protein [Candidatus Baltobacteraceae bacterium]